MKNILNLKKYRKKFNSIFYENKRISYFRVVLLSIFILGFLFRIVGTNPGYPPNHPDEPVISGTALEMVINRELNPFKFTSYRFQYPGLFVYLHAFLYFIFFIPLSLLFTLIFHPIAFFSNLNHFDTFISTYIVGVGGINALFWGRYITALVSSFSVVLVYLIGKELFNKYIGLLAALFLAVNFRHIVSSHLSLIDAPNSTFALLALYLSLLLLKKPSRKMYILAGLGAGLSFGTKFYFFSILPFLLAHLVISLKNKKINRIIQFIFNPNFIFSLLLIMGVFILFNPFFFFNPENMRRAIEQQTLNNIRYGMGSYDLIITPLWYLFEIGFGREFSILFIIGLIVMILNSRYWLKGIFLLIFIVPPSFLLLYYSHGGAYVRNFTSIVPFILIFSALAFYSIFLFLQQRIKIKNRWILLILVVCGLIIGFSQTQKSVILDYWLTKDWNYKCVLNWVEKNVKEKETIAITGSVPLVDSKKINYVPFTNNWLHNIGAFTLPELQAAKINYVIMSYDVIQSSFVWWVGGKLWGMPVEKFDNNYESLAVKELTRYEIKSCIKPWPSLDDNFSIIKIPEKKEAKDYRLIYSNNPSLIMKKILNQGNNPLYYPISSFIPAQPGKEYLISALVSAQKQLGKKQKDGFLRVDFYETNKNTDKRGKIAALSERYWGNSTWRGIKVSQIAPQEAKWLRVSFQAEDYTSDFKVKEVKIFISDDRSLESEIENANKIEIDNSIIYPKAIL